jgi:hypothetical protein
VTTVLALSAPGAALIAATVAALINLAVLAAVGLRDERRRRSDTYAAALEATLAYREFAYAIPRRRHDSRAEERVRISEALREVQRDLARADSLMKIERATKVAAAYRQLVAKTREVAGGYLHDAWKRPPISEDNDMNVPGGLDFSSLDRFEKDYLDAVAEDLAWYRFWR